MMGFADIAEGKPGIVSVSKSAELSRPSATPALLDDSPPLPPLAGSVALGLLPMLGKAPRNHASTQLV